MTGPVTPVTILRESEILASIRNITRKKKPVMKYYDVLFLFLSTVLLRSPERVPAIFLLLTNRSEIF